MKGIIVAGGLGTRLRPMTLITNKHLLPIYDRPMILYPLDTLRRSGITDILIVCGKEYASHFMNFLSSGREYGVKLTYAIQEKNDGGIADALRYGEDFADQGDIAMILGDNIFEDAFAEAVKKFKGGTMSFFKKVPDPERFGSPVFDTKGKIIRIEEKPKKAKSPYAHVGFYLFDARVFEFIRNQKPSPRGQLEIVDAVNCYIDKGEIEHAFVKGFWSDAGTIESLFGASTWARKKKQKASLKR